MHGDAPLGRVRKSTFHPLAILCMNSQPFVFPAVRQVQSFVIPADGLYVIEACGAQGGAGGGPGGKGARVRGVFRFQAGERLHVVVGQRGESGVKPGHAAGGGGGGSFVWRDNGSGARPSFPLLAAGGGGGGSGGDGRITADGGVGGGDGGTDGHGGQTDLRNFHYSGGGGAGWRWGGARGSLPTHCGGGAHWTGGEGANYGGFHGGDGGWGGGGGGSFFGHGSGGGGGYSGGGGGTEMGPAGGGGGSFNAGANQLNTPGFQSGHGAVSICLVEAFRSSTSPFETDDASLDRTEGS